MSDLRDGLLAERGRLEGELARLDIEAASDNSILAETEVQIAEHRACIANLEKHRADMKAGLDGIEDAQLAVMVKLDQLQDFAEVYGVDLGGAGEAPVDEPAEPTSVELALLVQGGEMPKVPFLDDDGKHRTIRAVAMDWLRLRPGRNFTVAELGDVLLGEAPDGYYDRGPKRFRNALRAALELEVADRTVLKRNGRQGVVYNLKAVAR